MRHQMSRREYRIHINTLVHAAAQRRRNPTPKTQTLTNWELLAIERSVVAYTYTGGLHEKYADALIEKLQRAESIRVTYRSNAE